MQGPPGSGGPNVYFTRPVTCQPIMYTILDCFPVVSQPISLAGTLANGPATIASLQVPAGSYLVTATVLVGDYSNDTYLGVGCTVSSTAGTASGNGGVWTPNVQYPYATVAPIHIETTDVSSGTDTISLQCSEFALASAAAQVVEASLTATALGSLTTQ